MITHDKYRMWPLKFNEEKCCFYIPEEIMDNKELVEEAKKNIAFWIKVEEAAKKVNLEALKQI